MATLTILLDFDGTLVDQQRQTAYQGLINKHAAPKYKHDKTLAKALYDYDKELCAQGQFNRRLVFEEHGCAFPRLTAEEFCRAFWEKVTEAQTVIGGACRALEWLEKDGHRLVCATDSDGPGGNKWKRVTSRKLGLGRFFEDRIFIGSERGVPRKGTTAYVEHIVCALGADKSLCVMVGDKPTADLFPARDVGVSTVLVLNEEYRGRDRWGYGWSLGAGSLEELPQIIQGLSGAVAVSYGPADGALAQELIDALKEEGIRALGNERNAAIGTAMATSITDAVRSLDVFVIVATKGTMGAAWCRHEMSSAARQAGSRREVLFAFGEGTSAPVPGLNCIQLSGGLGDAIQKIGQSVGRARLSPAWDSADGLRERLKPFYEHWRHLDTIITQRATLFVLANTVLFLAFGEPENIHIPTVTSLAVTLNVFWMVMSLRTLRSLDSIRQVIDEAAQGTARLPSVHLPAAIDQARRRGGFRSGRLRMWLSRPLRTRASSILCHWVPVFFIITWVVCGAMADRWSLVALIVAAITWIVMALVGRHLGGHDQVNVSPRHEKRKRRR